MPLNGAQGLPDPFPIMLRSWGQVNDQVIHILTACAKNCLNHAKAIRFVFGLSPYSTQSFWHRHHKFAAHFATKAIAHDLIFQIPGNIQNVVRLSRGFFGA